MSSIWVIEEFYDGQITTFAPTYLTKAEAQSALDELHRGLMTNGKVGATVRPRHNFRVVEYVPRSINVGEYIIERAPPTAQDRKEEP
jgi:hypothetical protein